MSYTPPTTEQLFVLNHIARIDAMAQHDRFAAATPDMVEAIVTGIGEFAADVYAPLTRVGDTQNPQWRDGPVTLPPRFQQPSNAFRQPGRGPIDAPGHSGRPDLPPPPPNLRTH